MPCLGCQPITSSATAAGNAGGARGVCPARRAEGSAPAGGRAGEPCAQRARGGGGGGERGLLLPVSRRGGPWRSFRCVFVEDPASTALGRCRGVEWTVPSPGHVTRTEPALLRPLSTRSLWWLHAGPHREPHRCLGLGAGSPAPPPPHRRIFTRAGLTGGPLLGARRKVSLPSTALGTALGTPQTPDSERVSSRRCTPSLSTPGSHRLPPHWSEPCHRQKRPGAAAPRPAGPPGARGRRGRHGPQPRARAEPLDPPSREGAGAPHPAVPTGGAVLCPRGGGIAVPGRGESSWTRP